MFLERMADAPFLLDTPATPAESLCDASQAARGIMRLFARNDIWTLAEMPLRGGRRADLMGVDAKGHVIIVEIKVSRADLTGDGKWTDYLDHCDKFYWGIGAHLDPAILEGEAFQPDRCGLIAPDGDTVQVIWLSQAAAVVLGHMIAVLMAHVRALSLFGTHGKAAVSQIPLALFMVIYTLFGLWLLASPRGG